MLTTVLKRFTEDELRHKVDQNCQTPQPKFLGCTDIHDTSISLPSHDLTPPFLCIVTCHPSLPTTPYIHLFVISSHPTIFHSFSFRFISVQFPTSSLRYFVSAPNRWGDTFFHTVSHQTHIETILCVICLVLLVLQCRRRMNHCLRVKRLTSTMWLQLSVILFRLE